jgi:hypothetical protein
MYWREEELALYLEVFDMDTVFSACANEPIKETWSVRDALGQISFTS